MTAPRHAPLMPIIRDMLAGMSHDEIERKHKVSIARVAEIVAAWTTDDAPAQASYVRQSVEYMRQYHALMVRWWSGQIACTVNDPVKAAVSRIALAALQ